MSAMPLKRRLAVKASSVAMGHNRSSGRGAIRTESTFRQPRFAQPIKTTLGILGVPVDGETFVSFNCETGGDPQHLRGLCPGLLKLSQLGVGGREPKMRPLQTRQARCAFAEHAHGISIPLEEIIGLALQNRR